MYTINTPSRPGQENGARVLNPDKQYIGIPLARGYALESLRSRCWGRTHSISKTVSRHIFNGITLVVPEPKT